MEKSLVQVMRNASAAIYLDSENRLVEAYVQYLQCLSSIASQLLENTTQIGYELVASKPVRKYVQLGQQCMERIGIILDKLDQGSSRLERRMSDVSRSVNTNVETEGINSQISNSTPVTPVSHPHSAMPNSQPRPPSHSSSVSSVNTTSLFSIPPSPLEEQKGLYRKPESIGPMALAYRHNQQLLNAYRSRTARMHHAAASTLSLTVQRKMAENLAIAKRQEAALEKKMKERQQRLEEQATRRFSIPTGMSKKEQEQRHIYKQILEYEQDTKWLADWRTKLDENPKDAALIHQLISEILRCTDHPLTLMIQKGQYKLCQTLHPLVAKKITELEAVQVITDDSETDVPNIAELLSPVSKGGNFHSLQNTEKIQTDPISEDAGIEKIETDMADDIPEESQSEQNPDSIPHDAAQEHTVSSDNVHQSTEEVGSDDLHIGVPEGQGDGSDVVTPADLHDQVKADLESAIAEGDVLTDKLKSNKKILQKMASLSIEKTVEDYEDEISDEIWGSEDEDVGELKSGSINCIQSSVSVSEKQDDLSKGRSESMDSTESVDSHTQKWRSLYNLSVCEDSQGIELMKNEAYSRHLKWISQDVHSYIEEIQVMFIVAYEKLDSAEGRDQCLASLEEPFFKPIWLYLLALFRLANLPKERALAAVMSKYHSVSPKDVGVRQKLCLVLPPGENQQNYIPYGPAITELKTVSDFYSPLAKLECLVRVSKCVCQCVEEYYSTTVRENSKKQPNIGADDLLPILTYVIIQSRVPQVVSECQAMEEFIHEGYLMGEEGYCLTSLQTAINYIVSIYNRFTTAL